MPHFVTGYFGPGYCPVTGYSVCCVDLPHTLLKLVAIDIIVLSIFYRQPFICGLATGTSFDPAGSLLLALTVAGTSGHKSSDDRGLD